MPNIIWDWDDRHQTKGVSFSKSAANEGDWDVVRVRSSTGGRGDPDEWELTYVGTEGTRRYGTLKYLQGDSYINGIWPAPPDDTVTLSVDLAGMPNQIVLTLKP